MVTADELIEELKSAGWRVSERYVEKLYRDCQRLEAAIK